MLLVLITPKESFGLVFLKFLLEKTYNNLPPLTNVLSVSIAWRIEDPESKIIIF